MNQHSKITQRHPSTGAQPSQQTAENAQKGQQQGHVWKIDEMIYKLVENNVAYAGEQFGENLRFNSEVLTNVLYDNIYKLVGEKFDSDEFAEWVADELLKNGYILKTTAPSASEDEEPKEEPKEEIVYAIAEKDYQDLLDRINATLVLLQINKDTIAKRIGELGENFGKNTYTSEELRSERDKQITALIDRIQSDREKIDAHVLTYEDTKRMFAEALSGIQEGTEAKDASDAKDLNRTKTAAVQVQGVIDKICHNWRVAQTNLGKIQKKIRSALNAPENGVSETRIENKILRDTNVVEIHKETTTTIHEKTIVSTKEKRVAGAVALPHKTPETPRKQGSKISQKPIDKTKAVNQRVGKQQGKPTSAQKPGKSGLGKSLIGTSGKDRGESSGKSLLGGKRKKKYTLAQRIKRKISAGYLKTKRKISNSIIGKTYRAIAKTVKFIANTVKKVVVFAKKTLVVALAATMFMAKTFYKASKFVGKMVRSSVKAVASGVKKVVKLAKKGALGTAIMLIAPGKIVTKMGWKALKFVGKGIWKGIKKLAFSAFQFFGKMFGLVGKFVNKVGHWAGILASGIKNKVYRFIVKPVASMMVSVFNFVSAVVTSPILFLKNVVSAMVDRTLQALENIYSGVKKVLKSTQSVLKRLLFNPITIAVIVGGLFLIFGKRLFGWLTGMVGGIRDTLVPMIVGFATKVYGFLKGVGSILFSVGKFLFKAIDWITNPKGILARFIVSAFKMFQAVKKGIKKLIKATGKSTIDTLCMFLAGDLIGLAIHAIAGAVKLMWDHLRKTKFMSIVIGIVKQMVAIGKLIFGLSTLVYRSLWAGFKQLIRFNFKGVVSAITKPWKETWQQVKDVFSGKAYKDEVNSEKLFDNPVESSSEQAKNTSIAVRSLGMKGKVESNVAYLNVLQRDLGQWAQGDLLPRIRKMNDLYQENSKQVGAFDEFLTKTWEVGSVGDDAAQQMLKHMLESPVISQKLMSVFFYYNPQTGQTQMLRPAAYIGQFLDNIRNMMSDPDRNDSQAFKTIIEAFDQLNKERSHIVNNQGRVLADFADKIAKFDKKTDKNGAQEKELKNIIQTFNKGDLFSGATAKSSFSQISNGQAKTKHVESVTGSSLGTNQLLKVKPLAVTKEGNVVMKDSDFVMPEAAKTPPSRDTIGNVILPPGSNPEPVVDKVDDKSIGEIWREHQKKRRDYINSGHTKEQAEAVGLKNYTLDEFKQNYKKLHPKSPEQLEKEQENQQRRAAALRNAKLVSAYHNQGKVANKDGFSMNGIPSIIKIETDNLSQTLYMFSPDWQKYYHAVELDEDQILLQINKDNKAAQERIRKRQEAAAAKKAEEEAQRKREQQILDYSAKVDGGFIEVKIGEDVDAMRNSWVLHQKKRREFINAGHTKEEAESAGLVNYTWDEWKRYYRKMHGLPEDGIKRIPFEGKRKERQIDWSARYPMSVDELAQYGIEVSEGGPVMIPLDKAMKAAGSLLANAKTIYSVRDGLEVMRQGLRTETDRLKAQNKEGPPVAAVATGGGEGGDATQPVPPDQSGYAEVG